MSEYPGRPAHCSGAMLVKAGVSGRVTRRVQCEQQVMGSVGLCARCAGLEADNRRELAEMARANGGERQGGRRYDG